jgi:hypothetical protein
MADELMLVKAANKSFESQIENYQQMNKKNVDKKNELEGFMKKNREELSSRQKIIEEHEKVIFPINSNIIIQKLGIGRFEG